MFQLLPTHPYMCITNLRQVW